MELDRITQPWDWRTMGTGADHERLWWANKPSAIPLAVLPAPTANSLYPIDITALYNHWKAAPTSSDFLPNFGLELRPTNTNNNFNTFTSGQSTDVAHRPMLAIQFDSPQGVPVVTA
jgi:hypothetical protein